ncbi:MAG: hypothetical protein EA343_12020 [Nodularia sp. (in: Bacteria)]|nr:MAG: hypothetical protein EA343_12020 [Nodularia sp. (in: cyanobacteria)]
MASKNIPKACVKKLNFAEKMPDSRNIFDKITKIRSRNILFKNNPVYFLSRAIFPYKGRKQISDMDNTI